MVVKHLLKSSTLQSTALLLSCHFINTGGLTIDNFFTDPLFEHMAADHDFVKMTYQRYGSAYFTEPEYIALYYRNELTDWLEWAQRSKGDYL